MSPLSRPEKPMDLLLWRHAEAEDDDHDLQRRLTPRGEKQARAVAAWLGRRLPRDLRILCSPAKRAQQTASALELPYETRRELAPDADVAGLIAASGWPVGGGAVLLVGHQPSLGRLAALLLAGEESPWTIKKGALWWFSNRVRAGETQTILRTAISPELLS